MISCMNSSTQTFSTFWPNRALRHLGTSVKLKSCSCVNNSVLWAVTLFIWVDGSLDTNRSVNCGLQIQLELMTKIHFNSFNGCRFTVSAFYHKDSPWVSSLWSCTWWLTDWTAAWCLDVSIDSLCATVWPAGCFLSFSGGSGRRG